MVDTLCDRAEQNTAIACFYFDYAAQKEQSPTNMLGSLLKQVVGGSNEIPEKIVQVFKDQKRFIGGRGLQLSQILELLEVASSLQRTFLCIDALDECVAVHRLKIIGSLRRVLQNSPRTRLFLTGRAHIRGEVESRLAGRAAILFIAPKKEDITEYLRARLDEDTNPEAMDDSLEADIVERIPETISEMYEEQRHLEALELSANGCASRFLLVSLNIDAILQETTIYRRRQRLRAMTGGLGLGDAYSETLGRIKTQGGEKARLGMAALMWICYSERPLHVDELCQALAVDINSPDFNSDNVPPISTLLGCCQGLVIVDKGASSVRLIHFSLKEYLCTRYDLFAGAHSTMAETCLTYLNSQHVNNVPPTSSSDLKHIPFLTYSSLYWGSHAKRGLSDRAKLLAMALFGQYGNHISARVLIEDQVESPLPLFTTEDDFVLSGLHCASIFGIVELARALIEMEGCDINQKDSAGFTPLIYAILNNREEIVKLLLAQRAIDPTGPDEFWGIQPLSWAASKGNVKVAELLLARKDVNPDSPSIPGGITPLSYAAIAGHEGMAKLLLAREDVDPNSQDTSDGKPPLSHAAMSGHEGVVKLLLAREGVKPDVLDKHGRGPISHAAMMGRAEVVKLFLAREDVNPYRTDNYNRTPLLLATKRGRREVVKLLQARQAANPSTLQTSEGGLS